MSFLIDLIQRSGVGDLSECLDRLLEIYQRGGVGALMDEFRRDPLATVICVMTVVLAVLTRIKGHDHEEEPVFAGAEGDKDLEKCLLLAEAMGIQQPQGGPISGAILAVLLRKLAEQLMEALMDWLNEQEG